MKVELLQFKLSKWEKDTEAECPAPPRKQDWNHHHEEMGHTTVTPAHDLGLFLKIVTVNDFKRWMSQRLKAKVGNETFWAFSGEAVRLEWNES